MILIAAFIVPGPLRGLKAQEKITLKATPKTVAWGYYDAKATPVLRVKSGDTVEIQTLVRTARNGWKRRACRRSRSSNRCATSRTR